MSKPLIRSFDFKWSKMNQSSGYRPLFLNEKGIELNDDNASELDERTTWKQRFEHLRLPSLLQLAVLALCIALSIITTLYIRLRVETILPPKQHCGTTTATALSRGCTFDLLAKVWLPPTCPKYGLDEYMSAAPTATNGTMDTWRYYRDRERTQEVSIHEMSEMADLPLDEANNQWWSTGSEHMVHCTWMLIRMAHAYDTGQRKDSFGLDFHHTKHCALFLLDRGLESPGAFDVRTVGNIGFGFC